MKDPYRGKRPPGAESGALPSSTECPGCGSAVDSCLRLCGRCGTPIAVVRCSECFHMNLPDASVCAGCSHELGLEPQSEPDELCCPDCERPFAAFQGGPGRLHDCGSCGGQFVDHSLLRDLLEQRELYGKAAPRPPARHNPLDSPMRYVPCPVCDEMMTRKNFGRSSGVIVDVCSAHGVWFDRGELPRVLAFVEAGGLVLAREREEQEKRERERRERVRQMEQTFQGLHGTRPVPSGSGQAAYEATAASLELLGAIADLIGRR